MSIREYHAHLYYQAENLEEARELAAQVKEKFSLEHGKLHEKLVGPHRMWNCCFAVPGHLLGEMIPWLMVRRGSVDILFHGITGDNLKDHTQHVMWLGKSYELNLDMFRPQSDSLACKPEFYQVSSSS